MTDTDQKLIFECQRGKMKAFKTLVEKYKKPTFFIALGLVGNREDAYDLSHRRLFFESLLAENVVIPSLLPEDESLVDNNIDKEPTKSN